MAETSRGIIYPTSDAHTRLWEHFKTLADTVNAAITAAIAAASPVDSGFIDVPYASGWKASGSGTPLKVRKIGKVCHITGTITNTANSIPATSGGADVATLPAGFLPAALAREVIIISSNNPGSIPARGYITTAGVIRMYTYNGTAPYVDFHTTYFTD